jgi:hypothetical protein
MWLLKDFVADLEFVFIWVLCIVINNALVTIIGGRKGGKIIKPYKIILAALDEGAIPWRKPRDVQRRKWKPSPIS